MKPRLRKLLFAIPLLALLIGASATSADSLLTTFESPDYVPGSIEGQDGWTGTGVPINPLVDQEIVTNGPGAPASFGAQSWRFSNAFTDGTFGTWPFSPSITDEAGETTAADNGLSGGTRQDFFSAQWQFSSAAPDAYQPGLQVSVSPDRGDGSRMSYIRMEDDTDGLAVYFFEYLTDSENPGCNGDFVETQVGSGLARNQAHSVRLDLFFYDGPSNDVVDVYVDGALIYTGTSWEDYFPDCEARPTNTVDSLLFQARSSAGTAPDSDGKGFLIDNVYVHSGPPSGAVIVNKDFVPDSDAVVSVELSCDDGTIGDATLDASEDAPAVFAVGDLPFEGTICSVVETGEAGGYEIDASDCQDLELPAFGTVSCTITNVAPLPTHCDGQAATVYVNANGIIVGGALNGRPYTGTLIGTKRRDVIIGTFGDDRIYGGQSDDLICALSGNDYVDGEQGNDTIYGGADNDRLYGDRGNDRLYGEAGNDYADGGQGDDYVNGGDDNDSLYGDNGRDSFDGGSGYDYCDGGLSRDTQTGCERKLRIP